MPDGPSYDGVGPGMMTRMRVTHEVRYDAPVAEVRAMLADPAFREKATLAMGASAVSVRVGEGLVEIDMASQAHHVPAFLRPLLGEKAHAVHAEHWTGDEADFSITTSLVPAGLHGRRVLTAEGEGCLDTFDGEAHARIPVVGGRIERLIADRLKEGWDIEHDVGVAWLAHHSGRPGGDR
jgi:Protein of unknown function (DUF2505)